jgi:hypothetical protein
MGALCNKENVPIELIACGFTKTMRKTEQLLLEQYWKAGYSFCIEENRPYWSNEYFKFCQYHIIKIIEHMNVLCEHVIIFSNDKPRWNTGNEILRYDETIGKQINMEPEFV